MVSASIRSKVAAPHWKVQFCPLVPFTHQDVPV